MIESSRSHGAFEEAYLGPLKLRNRVIKAATFEGMTDGNTVHPKLIEFHRRMAAGGVGMTTMAYIGVSPDGRGTPNELVPEAGRLPEPVHWVYRDRPEKLRYTPWWSSRRPPPPCDDGIQSTWDEPCSRRSCPRRWQP